MAEITCKQLYVCVFSITSRCAALARQHECFLTSRPSDSRTSSSVIGRTHENERSVGTEAEIGYLLNSFYYKYINSEVPN